MTEFKLSGSNIEVIADPDSKMVYIFQEEELVKLNYSEISDLYCIFQKLLYKENF